PFSLSCSTPSWLPFKKGPPYAKTKEFLNKEVVIIDGEEYVKVTNPKASEATGQSPTLYIPVNEYLSRTETFVTSIPPSGATAKGTSTSTSQTSRDSVEKEVFLVSHPSLTPQELKRKVVLTYFDDRSTQADETYGDWMAEKLTKEVSQRSQRILFIDYQLVKEFLEKGGYVLSDLETPKVLRLLDQAFGIHALVVGHLSGPYVFTTKTIKDRDEMAKAILKVETSIVDTLSGKTLKTLSATNPIIASREKGTYSEEKAKARAIDLAISDLSKALTPELDRLDWFCRVAKVEGEDIYINAGRLTGLRIGDVMEVFRSGDLDERREQKGKIQISGFFGIDASMGRLIEGKRPDVNDILRLAKDKGT
ncbi:MAG TPA: hypothetical protein VJ462_04765, partial [Thermodesulfobacteriota bacterium]|nr:hypothetical protein [Thermodesulfobacteriota bacterium]